MPQIVPVSSVASLISSVTSLVTAAVGWIGSYVQAITAEGNEILLLCCVAVPLVGLGVGLVKRLITIRA